MEFYYHPILGLQYNVLEQLFEINVAEIPKDFDYKKALNFLKKTGVHIVNSTKTQPLINTIPQIITNAYYRINNTIEINL